MSATEDDSQQAVDDNRPLSQNEVALLQRLLGDPFSFPTSFKTWLVSYLEASDLNLPISSVHGLSAALAATSTTTLSELEARIAALEARP